MVDEDKSYKYLRTMPIDSVEEENFARLMKEREAKEKELEVLKAKSIESMWLGELNTLKIKYRKYKQERKNRQSGTSMKKIKLSKKKQKIKKKM